MRSSTRGNLALAQEESCEAIRRRAYKLWEEEGCPAGRELDHWCEAEKQLLGTNEPDSKQVSVTKRKPSAKRKGKTS